MKPQTITCFVNDKFQEDNFPFMKINLDTNTKKTIHFQFSIRNIPKSVHVMFFGDV